MIREFIVTLLLAVALAAPALNMQEAIKVLIEQKARLSKCEERALSQTKRSTNFYSYKPVAVVNLVLRGKEPD